MLFWKFWKKFPIKKSKKSGYYSCKLYNSTRSNDIIILYWDNNSKKFTDKSAKNIIDNYQIRKYDIIELSKEEKDNMIDYTDRVYKWKICLYIDLL